MQLTHTRDNGLAGLFVGAYTEGGVLFRKRVQRLRELLLVSLGLGLHGHVNNGLGEDKVFQLNRVIHARQGVTGVNLLETHGSNNVSGADGVDVLALVGVHQEEASKTLLLVTFGGVVNGVTLFQGARVHAKVGQLTDVGVGHDLKCQRREGLSVIGVALEDIFLARLGALGWRKVEWAWQEVHHGVEHGLYTLVLKSRSVQDWHAEAFERSATERLAYVGGGDLFVSEDLLHQRVVEGSQGVEQAGAVLVSLSLVLSGDVNNFELLALVVVVDRCLHRRQVDDAEVLRLSADGQLNNRWNTVQAVTNHLYASEEVRTNAVHLVDEADTRNVVLVGLAPHGLRLGLNTGYGVEYGNRTVEHAQ